jgi:hypothetical protein
VDDRVKELMKDLGEAISEAVSDSGRVESIMRAIQESGYQARLILEATIAIANNGHITQQTLLGDKQELDPDTFTAEDRRFLKLLKIDY